MPYFPCSERFKTLFLPVENFIRLFGASGGFSTFALTYYYDC